MFTVIGQNPMGEFNISNSILNKVERCTQIDTANAGTRPSNLITNCLEQLTCFIKHLPSFYGTAQKFQCISSSHQSQRSLSGIAPSLTDDHNSFSELERTMRVNVPISICLMLETIDHYLCHFIRQRLYQNLWWKN